jgi:hypothetical protein
VKSSQKKGGRKKPSGSENSKLKSDVETEDHSISKSSVTNETTLEGSFREPSKSTKTSAQNSLFQDNIPPEVIFFGDSRQPPPPEAAQDLRYHGNLLFWARHATVVPRNSEERLKLVFPDPFKDSNTLKYRMNPDNLNFEKILESFEAVMTDLESSKAFITANIDQVPTILFLRALTAKKLKAQYDNNILEMEKFKKIRNYYIVAHDQIFFPLNIEIQKAQTRVMTYITRSELRQFAKSWDAVEVTLYFFTMLSARLAWDAKVTELLDSIKKRVAETVDYMAEGVRRDLMTREFRRPGITSEIYTNSTIQFTKEFPYLYSKVSLI